MSTREDLKKKLRDKIKGKQIIRTTKEQKETLIDNQLKKAGIDPETFKEQMKNINPNLLKEELKKLNISI